MDFCKRFLFYWQNPPRYNQLKLFTNYEPARHNPVRVIPRIWSTHCESQQLAVWLIITSNAMSLTWKDAATETTLRDYATRIFLLRGGSSANNNWRETPKTAKLHDFTFARHNNHEISQLVYLSLFISPFLSAFYLFYFPNSLFLLRFPFIRHFLSSLFSLCNSYIFFQFWAFLCFIFF
jgi:hypothetical protein